MSYYLQLLQLLLYNRKGTQLPYASHTPIMSPDKHLSPQLLPLQRLSAWTLQWFISGATHPPLPSQIDGYIITSTNKYLLNAHPELITFSSNVMLHELFLKRTPAVSVGAYIRCTFVTTVTSLASSYTISRWYCYQKHFRIYQINQWVKSI